MEEAEIAKDADETTTQHPTPPRMSSLFPPTLDGHLTPLPPLCMPVGTVEHESKTPPPFMARSIGARREKLVGTKRKGKHGAGGKQKSSKRMMP